MLKSLIHPGSFRLALAGCCGILLFHSCVLFHPRHSLVVKAADTTLVASGTTDSSAAYYARLLAGEFRFETFSAKLKLQVKTEASGQSDYTATLRMKADSAIWISAGQMGIEGIRVFITPDSVRIWDKLEKKYYSRDFSVFNELLGLPVDFNTLQDVLAGRPVYFQPQQMKAARLDSLCQLTSFSNGVQNTLMLSRKFQLMSMKMVDAAHNRDLAIDYFQYNPQLSKPFSEERVLVITQPKPVEISILFNKVKVNEPVKFPFRIKAE